MMGLQEIVDANDKAVAAAVERTAAQDLVFCIDVLEEIANTSVDVRAQCLAAGLIQAIARSRGLDEGNGLAEELVTEAA